MKKFNLIICLTFFTFILWFKTVPTSFAATIPDTFPTSYPCDEVMIIEGTVTLENETINKNIYITKGSTLVTDGTVTINGDVYVFGIFSNLGYIYINKTLYCLNYLSSMSAGDYDYGYFFNYGSGHISIIGVIDNFLPYGIPTVLHNFSDWEALIEETCTLPGYSTRTCSTCGQTESRIDQNYMNGHEYGEWYVTKPASCGITGTKERKCLRNDSTQTAEIPALSHAFTAWTTSIQPTAASSGVKIRYCFNCDTVEEEEVFSTNISIASVTQIKQQTYTGKSIRPKFTVKLSGKILKKNVDYSVTYKNNKKPGKATIVLKGKGDYKGIKKISFYISPKRSKITAAANSKSSTITLKYKKVPYASGYRITYATNKTFKKAKTVFCKSTTKTLKNLKKGKTYYIKVCPYKVISKVKIYGPSSTMKRVRVTK